MKKLLMVVHWLSIALINGAMLTCFYLYFFDNPVPIVFHNLPFPTDKHEYKRGDGALVLMDFCKNITRQVPITLDLFFVDGIMFHALPIQTAGVANGCNTSSLHVEIPPTLPAGEYHLHGTIIYHVNFLRDRLVEWDTQKFVVVE